MHIQKGIKFLLHKRGKGDSEHLSIRMRVTLKGQPPFDFPTGHNINLVDWDMGNQRALASCEAASTINRTIDEWKSVMNEIFARYELIEKRIPTPGEVKDLFNDMVGRKQKPMNHLLHPVTISLPRSICSPKQWANKMDGRMQHKKSSVQSRHICNPLNLHCLFTP